MDPIDFSVIGTDVHSHLIPGIDDGADSLENSIELIKGLKNLGYKKIITTPHVMSDMYPNTKDGILRGYEKVKEALIQRNIQVEFEAAAEYFVDQHFEELISKNELLTFGDNYVLFELPFGEAPLDLKNIIFDLQMAGYRPVMAHPERYPYWHKKMDVFHELHLKDVILQININSLSGQYSPEVQQTALKMIDARLVKMVGSDTHHLGHIELLSRSATSEGLHELINSERLINPEL